MPSSITATKSVHRAGAPAGDSRIVGETPLPRFTANGVVGALTWSDNGAGGVFTPVGGGAVDYTPANELRSVVITADDDGAPVSVTLEVVGSFPMRWAFGYDADIDDNTKVSYAEDDTPYFDEKGEPKEAYSIKVLGCTRADMYLLRDFWKYHRKSREFYLVDPEINQTILVRFDSKLGRTVVSANSFDIAALMREA